MTNFFLKNLGIKFAIAVTLAFTGLAFIQSPAAKNKLPKNHVSSPTAKVGNTGHISP